MERQLHVGVYSAGRITGPVHKPEQFACEQNQQRPKPTTAKSRVRSREAGERVSKFAQYGDVPMLYPFARLEILNQQTAMHQTQSGCQKLLDRAGSRLRTRGHRSHPFECHASCVATKQALTIASTRQITCSLARRSAHFVGLQAKSHRKACTALS